MFLVAAVAKCPFFEGDEKNPPKSLTGRACAIHHTTRSRGRRPNQTRHRGLKDNGCWEPTIEVFAKNHVTYSSMVPKKCWDFFLDWGEKVYSPSLRRQCPHPEHFSCWNSGFNVFFVKPQQIAGTKHHRQCPEAVECFSSAPFLRLLASRLRIPVPNSKWSVSHRRLRMFAIPGDWLSFSRNQLSGTESSRLVQPHKIAQ